MASQLYKILESPQERRDVLAKYDAFVFGQLLSLSFFFFGSHAIPDSFLSYFFSVQIVTVCYGKEASCCQEHATF